MTLVAGAYFTAHAEPTRLWPHDGLVSQRSARAELVPTDVLPSREVHDVDDVHSIFFADAFGLDWTRRAHVGSAVLALVAQTLPA